MTLKPRYLFFLTIFLFYLPVSGHTATYDLEKPHTQILFFCSHLGFSKSQGKFLDFSGSFEFDEASPDKSSVDVKIKAASLEMNDAKWNEHLKSADFFNVDKYPEIMFKSTGIKMTGENTAIVTGDLTLLGVTKPVALTTTFNKAGVHPISEKFVAGFSASTTLKRSEFGMKYGLPALGDDVEIRLEVEGIRR